MSRTSLSNSTRVCRFDFLVKNHLLLLHSRCLPLFFHFNSAKAIVHQESVNYLDLAVSPRKHTNWRKEALNSFLRKLSYPCMEFFLAETFQPNLRVLSVYIKIVEYSNERLASFNGRLAEFEESSFIRFEKKILKKIKGKDCHQKKLLIRRYLRGYRLLNVDRFTIKYPTLINLCTNPPLDCKFTIDVINNFCDADVKKLNVFSRVPNARSLETLILHAKDMRFDFWGLWSGNGILALVFDFIPYFMDLDVNQEFSRILLKYGFPYMAGQAAFKLRCVRLMSTKFEGRKIIKSADRIFEHVNSEQRKTRMMLILDTFAIFGNFEMADDAEDRIQTLVYLTRSLPIPYVTPRELYKTMLKAVFPEFQPLLRSIAYRYANADVFEDNIDVYMPRSLEHLCRVAIRKILADQFLLLDGIEKLPITGQLRSYLKLES